MTSKIAYVRTVNGISMRVKGRSFSFTKGDALFQKLISAIDAGADEVVVLDIIKAAGTTADVMPSKIAYVRTGSGISMCLKGRSYSFAKEDSVYPDLVSAINSGADDIEVLDIINAASNSFAKAACITSDVKILDGIVYFQNEPVHTSLADRMVQMLNEGFDLVPMAKFLENLMHNPSHTSVQELYAFLEKGQMPITPDGYFMAYKAVRKNYMDIHSGTFDNSIGKVCEMPRNGVDDDRSRTCSYGLHFCSFEYLPHFAHDNGHVMLVKINPADVVSIPADYNDTKGRCARYEVVGEYEGYYTEHKPYFTSMVYDPESDNDFGDGYVEEDDDYEVYADGDFIDSYDDLTDAKHDAVEMLEDYDEIEVRNQSGHVVFSIKNRS